MQTFSRLNKLHLCPTKPTVNKVVDVVRKDHRKELLVWKKDVMEAVSDTLPCKRSLQLEAFNANGIIMTKFTHTSMCKMITVIYYGFIICNKFH